MTISLKDDGESQRFWEVVVKNFYDLSPQEGEGRGEEDVKVEELGKSLASSLEQGSGGTDR